MPVQGFGRPVIGVGCCLVHVGIAECGGEVGLCRAVSISGMYYVYVAFTASQETFFLRGVCGEELWLDRWAWHVDCLGVLVHVTIVIVSSRPSRTC